ncbi:MAG: phasin family protein [Burkholderiales bacterium]
MANQLFDIYRNSVRTTAEMMRLSLENAVRLHEKQLGMVKSMLDENVRSTERAAEAQSMEQLVALQSELAGRQLECMSDFWSSVWTSAAESQRNFFERVRSEGADTARKAYDSATRITEDMARAAATPMSRASSQERKERKSA